MKKKTLFVLCLINAMFLAYAQSGYFTGSWTGDVESGGSFLTYKLTFRGNAACTVRVSVLSGGAELSQEIEGNYSFSNDILKISAVFSKPVIPNVPRVQWASVVTFGDNSFNILAKPDFYSQSLARITFIREDISYINNAIGNSFAALFRDIPVKARVAFLNIASKDVEEGAFIINELTVLFVNARKFTMVERQDINVILEEQSFQLSGYVDDNSAVSIGKFLGATVVITGSITGTGERKRLALKALDVLTAEILAMSLEPW
ncbi:MAG: CsgG/HfaB family protein [Treponema sp.]|nr:CsgG/HfaB family protein [Treponema sp.]